MGDERTEQRIVDLEMRYMRAEKMLQDLSDVLVAQQATIERLTAELSALRERLPEEPSEPASTAPPHY